MQNRGYWKLNVPFLVCETFRNLARVLVHLKMTDTMINTRWFIAMKRSNRVETVRFSKEMAFKKVG